MAREGKSEKPAAPAPGSALRQGERRKERERRGRRNLWITVGGVALALVAMIAFGVWSGNRPVEAPLPEGAQTRYADLAQSRTRDGLPRLGDPDAPIQVALYLSFDCTECRTFWEGVRSRLLDEASAGELAVTFAPLYGYADVTNGQGAARSALCAADQDSFWLYMEALYNWQQFGSQAYTNARILSGAEALGLNRTAFNACSLGGAPDGPLGIARTQARALQGFTEPPLGTINGVLATAEDNTIAMTAETFLAALDRAISNLSRVSGGGAEATPEATADANAEAEATPEATAEAEVTPEATAEAEVTPEATAEATAEAGG
jgi:hypothetical protein